MPPRKSHIAGVAEATLAARCRADLVDLGHRELHAESDHELGDPHAALDGEGLSAEVGEDHFDLATVVTV